MNRFAAVVTGLALFVSACGGGDTRPEPAGRAVAIETKACGDTSRTNGTGVRVGAGEILTAAHVVIGASAITVEVGARTVEASVVRLDVTNDLALLRVPDTGESDVELSDVAVGATVQVFGSSSGVVKSSVTRKLQIVVDDIRRTTRSERSGFELDAAILPGDSGAGVFDSSGRLVGVVFAVPTERDGATFAVDATEIASLLSGADQAHQCDPAVSLVVPTLASDVDD